MMGGGFKGGGSRQGHLRRLEDLFGGSPKDAAQPANKPAGRTPASVHSKNHASVRSEVQVREKSGPSRLPSQYKMRLERIKVASTPEEEAQAVAAFLAQHEIPPDLDILLKVLRHPDEALVRRGLMEIVTMLQAQSLAGTSVVSEAIEALAQRATEEQTLSYIAGIRSMLKT